MSRLLGAAVIQRGAVPGGAEGNLNEIEATLDSIAATYPWVDLILFPELAVQGFGDYAESIPGPSTDRLAKKAKELGKYVIPGSMLELDGDKMYNSTPVFSPDGEIIALYRKMNPFSPLEPTTPGTECVVFEIPGVGKIGLANCYDLWFPEMSRTLVSMGADVILHLSLTPANLNSREVLCRSSMAMLNQVYVLGASNCGVVAGIPTAGGSAIVDPDGTVLQKAGDSPSILVDMLNLDTVNVVRDIGIKGIAPIYKHLKHYGHTWSVDGNQKATSPYVDSFSSPYDLVRSKL